MAQTKDANENFQDDKLALSSEAPTKTKEHEKSKTKKWMFPGFGMVCTLLSALFFSINALVVKMVDLHPLQLSFLRCCIQFLLLLPIVQHKSRAGKLDILGPPDLKAFLWLRGLVGACSLIFLYLAVDELSMGNAITITYISMILVPFIAKLFLKESLTVLDLVFAIVSLIGVVLIAQPTFLFPAPEGGKTQSVIGVLYALSCATLQATCMVVIRKLGRETYPPLNVLSYSACGALITAILLGGLKDFRMPCKMEVLYTLSLGVTGLLGQFFLTFALQAERAGTVGVLRAAQIIMVYVLQVTVLGDIPTTLSLVGASLIFSSSIGIGIRKIFNERRRRKSVAKT